MAVDCQKDRLPTNKNQNVWMQIRVREIARIMFEGDFLWGLKALKFNNLANRSVWGPTKTFYSGFLS